jgi:hypothetical protein
MPATRNKTEAALLAMCAGVCGAHRFYLKGWRDALGWMHLPLFAAGLWGAWRWSVAGFGDAGARLGLPLLGLSIALALFQAVLLALTPDARWDAKWNPDDVGRTRSGWGAIGVISVSLLACAACFMATLALVLLQVFHAI